LNKSYSEEDLIVICDLCEGAVHQQCYGGELLKEVPSDQWFCQRCDYLLSKKLSFYSVKCTFCPEVKGIMKELNGFLWVFYFPFVNDFENLKKSHLSCIKWIAELGKTNEKLFLIISLFKSIQERND